MAPPKVKKTKKKGERHDRNRRVLLDPASKAYRGWRNVEGDWTLSVSKTYVGWCHIDKLFPYYRHKIHLNQNMANLHYCKNDAFVQRCIEVYRWLYKTNKVPRSEVSLGICQMVYAELELEQTVDWRSMKASKKLFIPTDKDIPRAGLGNNPRDGLGPRKHIIEGVADEDFEWSSSDNSMEEKDSDPGSPMAATTFSENTALVVFEGGNVREDVAMDVAPISFMAPRHDSYPRTDEVERHVYARLREIDEDDFYYEAEPEPTPQLMLKPSEDEVDDWIPEVQTRGEPEDFVYNDRSTKSMKKHLKKKLKDLRVQIEEKNEECQILLDRTTVDIETDDMHSLQELIDVGLNRLAVQHEEMAKLEDFYVNFNKGQDGGSSSNPKQSRKTELHKIMEECRMEEDLGNDARKSLEVAQSRWNYLDSIKDKGPLARTLEVDAVSVDGQQVTAPKDLDELKVMFSSLKMLEDEYEKSIEWKNSYISFNRVFKTFMLKNKSFVPRFFKSKRREENVAKEQMLKEEHVAKEKKLKEKALKEPMDEE